jgi:peptidoglycan/LPS O-acetylase OafA/YrhL
MKTESAETSSKESPIGGSGDGLPSQSVTFESKATNRYKIVDYIRGFAALSVCVCHLQYNLPLSASEFLQNGNLGVPAFFVISGFIIPYSMNKSKYRIKHIWRFLLKRLVRLQPTLWAALIITFALSRLATSLKGEVSIFPMESLLLNMAYIGYPAENPVIWSLIVEVKYYLLISLLFPILFSRNKWIMISGFGALMLACLGVSNQCADLRFTPYFLLGFTACYLAIGRVGNLEAFVLVLLTVGVSVKDLSLPQGATGLLTFLLIVLNPKVTFAPGMLLGEISYSLYLLHYPLGVKFINFLSTKLGGSWCWALFGFGVGICIASAILLSRLIERPSSKLSQRIVY